MNDLVAGEKGGVFPNSFPSLLPGPPALGNEKWNTFSRLGRCPGRALDARPRSLFTSSGRDDGVRVPPATAWEEVKERRWARTRDLCLASLCPGQHQFILVISKMSHDSGDVRRSSSSGRPGLRLIQRITALDFQPGPVTSTPFGTLVTEEFDFRRMQLHSN